MRTVVSQCVPQWGLGGVWTAATQIQENLEGYDGIDLRSIAVGAVHATVGGSVPRAKLSLSDILCGTASRRLFMESASTSARTVVHLHSTWHPELAMIAALCARRRVPYVVSPHGALDQWALAKGSLKKRAAMCAYQRSVLSRAAVVHCLTERERQDVLLVAGDARCIVVPNGIEVDVEMARLKVGGAGHGPLSLLFLSRLDAKKNLEALIDAMALLRDAGVLVSLRVVGAGEPEYEAGLKKRVASQGLSKYVTFVGPKFGRSKFQEYLSADVFVLPSHSEGLSMAVLEAMACGVPVLVSREADVGQVFESGAGIECGLSADSIARSVQKVAAEGGVVWQCRSDAARSLVRDAFSWRVLRPRYAELYRLAAETVNSAM